MRTDRAATRPGGTGRRGCFVVLDGIDGCGKSTQARHLVRALGERGAEALHLREPGSTPAGERLRALLLDPGTALDVGTETLLFVAARRQMLAEVVAPALAQGRDVVCERFHASTYAYQAIAGALDGGAVLELMQRWAGSPAPDLTVVLELDVGRATRRAAARGASDRFEERGPAFQSQVAEGFRDYARRSERVVVVDAAGPEDVVARRVLAEVEHVLV